MSGSFTPTIVTRNSYNEYINWIEEAITKQYFKYYEYNNFNNIEEGSFGTVYRENWKNASTNLGNCYWNGDRTDVDKKKAFESYQKAANLDDANGIFNLGYCYQYGIGTDVNKKRAFELFQKASNLGDSSGICGLGYYYDN
ncbi:hypothetical protein RirG_114610 [Rhizophagus irregularis DAOM 197198w]|uniref:HCP-like protein n=1 Tax=Rhizophagus irregularis (strain DAOM 197198w) TaxID=1432141 RepID=A0A015JD42_RHIIW|nr:hypothetical protein RirG_114610 [Rhizophagus irregularis DAOM 197198w]